MIDERFNEGIKRIYEEDMESQRFYIEKICSEIRNMAPNVVYRAHGFFVPNNDYMHEMFGAWITDPSCDVYGFEGLCRWHDNLVFPINDVSNRAHGIAGFNPINYLKAHETMDWSINYYAYTRNEYFNKNRFLFTIDNVIRDVIYKQSYLIITDGLFDTLSFLQYGYNAAALMGSDVSDFVYYLLSFIPKVIVAADNDEAGNKLVDKMQTRLDNIIWLKQPWEKDADAVIKGIHREEYFKKLDWIIDMKKIMYHVTSPLDRLDIFDRKKKIHNIIM